jgi:hypothetical protein
VAGTATMREIDAQRVGLDIAIVNTLNQRMRRFFIFLL